MTAIPPALERSGLSGQLWAATKALQTTAERSGIIALLLRGKATPRGYALLLRNLLGAYVALEVGLEAHCDTPGVFRLARPETYRSATILADLREMAGENWAAELPLLPEGERYAAAVNQAAEVNGTRLIAHAYVRTLGDLSGGQIVGDLLRRSLGLPEAALSFYRFPGIADIAAYKTGYRQSLDAAGAEIADSDAVAAEAALAFRLNIALSEAVAFLEPGVA